MVLSLIIILMVHGMKLLDYHMNLVHIAQFVFLNSFLLFNFYSSLFTFLSAFL